jgi:superfamily II DNA or RNA helicase
MSLPLPAGQSPLRWQIECLDAIRAGLQRYRSLLAAAATGSGKGSLLAGLAVLAALHGGQVVVLVHRDELIQDLARRIAKVPGAPRVGIVKADLDGWDCPIVVASVQSCSVSRLARIGRRTVVIIDEAHHATAPSYGIVIEAARAVNPDCRVVGLTATPYRAGENGTTLGLGSVFEAIVYEYPIARAIEEGVLVPLKAHRVDTQIDLSQVAMSGADYDEVELSKVVNDPARNRLVVEKYLELGGGQALVFGASVKHAQDLAAAFMERGIKAAAAWGEMPRHDRDRVVADYQAGRIQVLTSKDLLFEGFDAPATVQVLKARPTRSIIVFVQTVGRGLRRHPGKTHCNFVDFVDNGCDLVLTVEANLGIGSTEDAQGERALHEGDRVRRRHHDDWGVGVVAAVQIGTVSYATVEWPPSPVHKDGEELTHPWPELAFVAPDKAEKPVPMKLASVTGRLYEVCLLPGVRKRDRIGFFEYSGAHCVGGEVLGAGGARKVVAVRPGASGYVVWELDGVTSILVERHRCRELEVALSWADSHVRALGVEVLPPDHPTLAELATSMHQRMLQSLGVTRSTVGMSRGEAAMLIDAARITRRIREREEPGKFRVAEQLRKGGWKRRGAA